MKSFKKLIKTNEYWIEEIQNEIFRQLNSYIEKEKINQTQLAERFEVSKAYVSQILNGNFNFSLKKLVDLSLRLDLAPIINFKTLDEYYQLKINDNIISMPATVSIIIRDQISTESSKNDSNVKTLELTNNGEVTLVQKVA